MNLTKTSTLAFTISAILTNSALSDSQTVEGKLTLEGFINNSISISIRTSDFGAAYHSCSPNNTNGCNVQDPQSSIPKNIGNILCLPSAMNFTITDGCQSLLTAGSSDDCQSNSAKDFCHNGVAPACNYRTTNNASTTAEWDWILTQTAHGLVQVDCKETGYQGYTE
ncbi:hypothetical protein [Roseibium sp. M-1]